MDYAYLVARDIVAVSTTISLYWARGETFDTVIGGPIPGTTQTIPVSLPGTYGSFHVSNAALGTRPIGATNLLVVVDPGDVVKEINEGNNVQALPLPLANPTTTIGGAPASSPEGTAIALTGSSPDPGGPLTYAWAVTKNGAAYATGAGTAFTFTPDDNGTYAVTLTVTNGVGGMGTDTKTIAVTNVAPTVPLGGPTSVNEGSSYALTFGSVSDPGTDTVTGYTVNWGDGSPLESYGGSPGGLSKSHVYADNGSYTITVTLTDEDGTYSSTKAVTVSNVAPTATLGTSGPVNEGSPVTVGFTGPADASPVDAASLHYSFATSAAGLVGSYTSAGSAPFANFTFTDNGNYVVYGRIFDKDGGYTDYQTVVVVTNAAPTAGVVGPASGVRGQSRTFTLSATDSSPADRTAGFVYTVNWGDGSPLQTISRTGDNGAGVSADHSFPATGTFNVTVTATDKDGGVSAVAKHTITVVAVQQQGNDLVVGGTTGNDTIGLLPVGASGVLVLINLVPSGTFSPNGRVMAYGQGGNDVIEAVGLSLPAWLYGGDGNDLLAGGNRSDVLLGGTGNDLLYGGSGRDLLIGGAGADGLVGDGDDDLLIAGTTSFDDNQAALTAIMAEWTSSRAYTTRVAELRGTAGSGLNGSYFLKVSGPDATVFDDGAVDVLHGDGGTDWFFANRVGGQARDVLLGVSGSELVDELTLLLP